MARRLGFARVNSVVGRAGSEEETARGDLGSTDAEVSAVENQMLHLGDPLVRFLHGNFRIAA